ncbi:MAG: SRPBCC family protein [Ilumatobacteraceae bacterium]|nr:SRPBCC family protein [Ilumatobacteraceae bacterium]
MKSQRTAKDPVTVSREIDATPEQIWALVTDLPRMGEWSPENRGGEWSEGATGPSLGACFKGANSNKNRNWKTTVVVIAFDAPIKFAFALRVGKAHWCDWIYEIEATATGSLVTHSWIDRRSKLSDWIGGIVSKVDNRAEHNGRNMAATLDALAVAAVSESR